MATSAALAELADQTESLTKRLEAVGERCVVLDDELWYWTQYRAKGLGKPSVSEYVRDLVREDRNKSK